MRYDRGGEAGVLKEVRNYTKKNIFKRADGCVWRLSNAQFDIVRMEKGRYNNSRIFYSYKKTTSAGGRYAEKDAGLRQCIQNNEI